MYSARMPFGYRSMPMANSARAPSRSMVKPEEIYEVYVVHFVRLENTLPFHWEIAVKTGESPTGRPIGNVYHLAGAEATFHFEKLVAVRYQAPDQWRGSLLVGTVSASALPRFEALLEKVEIKNDPEWNCQNWVWDGLRKLWAREFDIDSTLVLWWPVMRARMTQLLKDWESADD